MVHDIAILLVSAGLVVSFVCMVLGMIMLHKGKVKKAVVFALVGTVYSSIVIVGVFIDDAVDTRLLEKDIEERNNQLYGEKWKISSSLAGIPKL